MLLQEKLWNEDIQRYIFGKWRISKLPVREANLNEYLLKKKKINSVLIGVGINFKNKVEIFFFLGCWSTTYLPAFLHIAKGSHCKRTKVADSQGKSWLTLFLGIYGPWNCLTSGEGYCFLQETYINCSIRLAFYNNLSLFVFKFDRCLNKVRQDTIFSFPLDDRILCVVKLTWHFSPIL